MPAFRTEAGAIVLAVRLTPRAGRDAIDGKAVLSDGREVSVAGLDYVFDRDNPLYARLTAAISG